MNPESMKNRPTEAFPYAAIWRNSSGAPARECMLKWKSTTLNAKAQTRKGSQLEFRHLGAYRLIAPGRFRSRWQVYLQLRLRRSMLCPHVGAPVWLSASR